MARTFTPKTPGVFPDPESESAESPSATAELVMQPAPDIAAMIAAEVRKGVAAALASQSRAIVQAQPEHLPDPIVQAQPEHLPDQSEVRADQITEVTLTKQGYVIPAKYGSFAADIVKN